MNLDGSAANFWKYWKTYGVLGIHKIWPMPSLYSLKLIVGFGVLEALLQLYVPGERYFGPISPAGYRALYKVHKLALLLDCLYIHLPSCLKSRCNKHVACWQSIKSKYAKMQSV